MSILPKDYKEPASNSGYMKFQQGENVFRILSDAITGWEWWTEEVKDGKLTKKANRVAEQDGIPAEMYDEEQPPKHFWAMIVWNYQEKKVQILEITQRGIQKSIAALERSKGWGDAKKYDLSVTKTGEKMETEYTVMPVPPQPLGEEIEEKYKKTKINLDALYLGEDPFKVTIEEVDPEEIEKGLKV